MAKGSAPEALMLLSSHCSHCPAVLQALAQLVKEGVLGRLEVVNIEQRPEVAASLGIRSVPWVQLGPFQLVGVRGLQELRDWAEKAGSSEGMADYFAELLETGEVREVIRTIREQPATLEAVIRLLGDADLKINARIGIGVVMEEFAGSELLKGYVAQLGALTRHPQATIRTDACHYLSLTGSGEARPFIESLLEDEDAAVREVARESLEALAKA